MSLVGGTIYLLSGTGVDTIGRLLGPSFSVGMVVWGGCPWLELLGRLPLRGSVSRSRSPTSPQWGRVFLLLVISFLAFAILAFYLNQNFEKKKHYSTAISHFILIILAYCFTWVFQLKSISAVLYYEKKNTIIMNRIWLILGPTQRTNSMEICYVA